MIQRFPYANRGASMPFAELKGGAWNTRSIARRPTSAVSWRRWLHPCSQPFRAHRRERVQKASIQDESSAPSRPHRQAGRGNRTAAPVLDCSGTGPIDIGRRAYETAKGRGLPMVSPNPLRTDAEPLSLMTPAGARSSYAIPALCPGAALHVLLEQEVVAAMLQWAWTSPSSCSFDHPRQHATTRCRFRAWTALC